MAGVADTLAKHCIMLAEVLRQRPEVISTAALYHEIDNVIANVNALNYYLDSFRKASAARTWTGN